MPADELIDVLDESGAVIGTKSRARVHQDGDWHGLIFVWSAWLEEGRSMMMLQRRARRADPFSAQVDALAGGHLLQGECPVEGAVRELEEEVGLQGTPSQLVELGTMRMERPDVDCRRVIEHLFLCPVALQIDQLKTSDEVDGFAQVSIADLADLIETRRDRVTAHLRDQEGTRVGDLSHHAVSAYPPTILETFRRSLAAIEPYLQHGETDPGLIEGN